MSTKDPTDGLTDKERAIFDRNEATCSHGIDKLSQDMQAQCVDHKVLLNSLAAQKSQKAANDKTAQENQLLKARLTEVVMIQDWVDRWQTQAAALLASFVNASAAYDTILKVNAERPIDYDVIVELAIVLLPEIKVVGAAYKRLVTPSASNDVIEGLEWIGVQLSKEPQQRFPGWKEAVEMVDRRSKDIVTIGRGVAKRGGTGPLDAASHRLRNAYVAKNSVFDRLINNAIEHLLGATAAATPLRTKVLESEISKGELQTLINSSPAGDPGPVLTAEQYELLSDQLLYQMLREYMQTYGDLLDTTTSDMTWKRDDISAGGIDQAGLDMIFARFNSGVWTGDSNFPPINTIEDMATKWQLKIDHKTKVQFTTK